MSIDSDPSFWKWLTGSIASAGGTLFGYHKYIVGRIDRKADKKDLDDLKSDMQWQRENIAKLFDQIRDSDQRNQDRFEKILEKL